MLDTFFTEKDFSDEDDDADVDNVPGLEFRIPRDRVISLRDNLLNLVSHYFNRHEGTLSILYILHYLINIPSKDTPRIQECHMILGHTICELVEIALFPKP